MNAIGPSAEGYSEQQGEDRDNQNCARHDVSDTKARWSGVSSTFMTSR